jgi:hypothetical protein
MGAPNAARCTNASLTTLPTLAGMPSTVNEVQLQNKCAPKTIPIIKNKTARSFVSIVCVRMRLISTIIYNQNINILFHS